MTGPRQLELNEPDGHGRLDALGNPLDLTPRSLKKIPKADLRKIKQQVARLRKKGLDVWTDDEVAAAGYSLDEPEAGRGLGAIVRHKRQSTSSDCGLACTEMVLTALGLEGEECSCAALRSRLGSDSIWTIDLAYLLADYGVVCEYYSATCDVDVSTYSSTDFYAESLAADTWRVRLLFANAQAEGVRVSKRQLGHADVWNLLRADENLVIALVDAQELRSATRRRGFAGHYVLVTGVDEARDGFYFKDPGHADETSFISSAQFERARTAVGTDEDLLLISIYQTTPTVPNATSIPAILRLMNAQNHDAVSQSIR